MRKRSATLLGTLENFPPSSPMLRQQIIESEGTYEDIDEWEKEEVTAVEEYQSMETLVYGPPKTASVAQRMPRWAATVDDMIYWYLTPSAL